MMFDFFCLAVFIALLKNQRDLKIQVTTLQSQVDGLIALDQERE